MHISAIQREFFFTFSNIVDYSFYAGLVLLGGGGDAIGGAWWEAFR